MKKLIVLLRRLGVAVYTTSQRFLLAAALFCLYFFVFSWFSPFAKLLERRKLEKERFRADSFWLKPALENPSGQTFFEQS